jgi:hypothetical protein
MTQQHFMSVVADGSDVRYVLGSGKTDPALTPERARRFAAQFEEDYGRAPESSEDWADCASRSLGFATAQEPVEHPYEAITKVVENEIAAIDEEAQVFSEPKTMSDSSLDGPVFAYVSDSGTVVGLQRLQPNKPYADKEWWRTNGVWTEESPVNGDDAEDLGVIEVSPDYIEAFDSGKRSESDAKANANTSEEQ